MNMKGSTAMSRIGLFVITLALAVSSLAGQPPTRLRCEWRVNPTEVPDPHPELYWETASQSAYQVRVARSRGFSDKSATTSRG